MPAYPELQCADPVQEVGCMGGPASRALRDDPELALLLGAFGKFSQSCVCGASFTWPVMVDPDQSIQLSCEHSYPGNAWRGLYPEQMDDQS